MTVLQDRQAGVCLHLTSLPGARGIGELGRAAYRFIDGMDTAGLGVWQFLPLAPTGYGDSPYQPLSVYAGNPLLIDLELLEQDGLVTADEIGVLEDLPSGTVDFDRLIPLKSQILARAGERFAKSASSAMRAARDDFVAACDATWLHDYALFEVLRAMHQQRSWLEWDRAFALRDPAAMARLEEAARAQIESIKSIQFLFFEQWSRLRAYAAEKRIRLMGDVPIFVALDSADAWARPELLYLDANGMPTEVAGVPPDYFSADGQLWGNPLYRWEQHEADGFAWWIGRIRHMTELVDLIRVDHFRGFEAYWSVPGGAPTARDGEWHPGPGAALFEAVSAELGELPIIAEDLGVITPAVEALRDRFGFPGMKVLHFLAGEAHFEPDSIPENCVCYTGTHDNDTTVGWFFGGPGDVRTPEEVERMQANVLEATRGTRQSIHADLTRLAYSTRARLAIAPMQDYLGLGSSARLNTPGTTSDNWRWRLTDEQSTPRLWASVADLVTSTDRTSAAA
jgi:4-alpha-glucanotransferase